MENKTFSVHRLKALEMLCTIETYPTPEIVDIARGCGGLDLQAQKFLEWLNKKLKAEQPLPTNTQIYDKYTQWSREIAEANKKTYCGNSTCDMPAGFRRSDNKLCCRYRPCEKYIPVIQIEVKQK